VADGREPPVWERERLGLGSFLATTWGVLWSPRGFFRRLQTRQSNGRSRVFALLHNWISAYVLSVSAAVHLLIVGQYPFITRAVDLSGLILFALLGGTAMTPAAFALIAGTKRFASALTVFEAKLHGLRMPGVAVGRALDYHAAAMLPVAVVTLLLTGIYATLRVLHVVDAQRDMMYLYVLCGWVVLSAGYLFQSYWRAMKGVMWANR
jgi:hypothetical protein